MANLRATIRAYKGNRLSEASRLASSQIITETATWHTSVKVDLRPNGHAWITVYRDGKIESQYYVQPES